MSRDDPNAWALAQPSYGVATTEREIRSKRQKANTFAQVAIFDADYLGWGDYPPDEVEGAELIPAEVWRNMANDTPDLSGARTLAVDRSPDRKTWAIAAAQRTTDGRIHLEVGYFDAASSSEVVAYLVSLVIDWDPRALVIDSRSAAAPLQPYLADAGVEAEMANSSDFAMASGGFLDDALSGRLSHCGQRILDDAVASATKRDLAGGIAWDRARDGSIAPLVAATLSHWGLLQLPPPVRMPVGPAFTESSPHSDEDGSPMQDDGFIDLDRVAF
jgi:hypothetical protein